MVGSDEVETIDLSDPSSKNFRSTQRRSSYPVFDVDSLDTHYTQVPIPHSTPSSMPNRVTSTRCPESLQRPPLGPSTSRRRRPRQVQSDDNGDDNDDDNAPDNVPGSKKPCTQTSRHRSSQPNAFSNLISDKTLLDTQKILSSIQNCHRQSLPGGMVTRLAKSKRSSHEPTRVIDLDRDNHSDRLNTPCQNPRPSEHIQQDGKDSDLDETSNGAQRKRLVKYADNKEPIFNKEQLDGDRDRRDGGRRRRTISNSSPYEENRHDRIIDLVSMDSVLPAPLAITGTASNNLGEALNTSTTIATPKDADGRRRSPRHLSRSRSVNATDQTADMGKVSHGLVDLAVESTNVPYVGPTNLIFVFPPGERGSVRVTAEERKRLITRMYLNDSLIDFYIKYLETRLHQQAQAPENLPVFFSSFFFGRMSRKKPIDHDGVKNWTKNIELFGKKFVFVPICDSFHWSLIIVINLYNLEDAMQNGRDSIEMCDAPKIIYLDSLDPTRGTDFGHKMIHYLVEEWLARKMRFGEEKPKREKIHTEFKKVIRICRPNVPVQSNEYDCGLYVLQCLKMVLEDTNSFCEKLTSECKDLRDVFTQTTIERLRNDIKVIMDKQEEVWIWKKTRNSGTEENGVAKTDGTNVNHENNDNTNADNENVSEKPVDGMNVDNANEDNSQALAAMKRDAMAAVASGNSNPPVYDKEFPSNEEKPKVNGVCLEKKVNVTMSESRARYSHVKDIDFELEGSVETRREAYDLKEEGGKNRFEIRQEDVEIDDEEEVQELGAVEHESDSESARTGNEEKDDMVREESAEEAQLGEEYGNMEETASRDKNIVDLQMSKYWDIGETLNASDEPLKARKGYSRLKITDGAVDVQPDCNRCVARQNPVVCEDDAVDVDRIEEEGMKRSVEGDDHSVMEDKDVNPENLALVLNNFGTNLLKIDNSRYVAVADRKNDDMDGEEGKTHCVQAVTGDLPSIEGGEMDIQQLDMMKVSGGSVKVMYNEGEERSMGLDEASAIASTWEEGRLSSTESAVQVSVVEKRETADTVVRRQRQRGYGGKRRRMNIDRHGRFSHQAVQRGDVLSSKKQEVVELDEESVDGREIREVAMVESGNEVEEEVEEVLEDEKHVEPEPILSNMSLRLNEMAGLVFTGNEQESIGNIDNEEHEGF